MRIPLAILLLTGALTGGCKKLEPEIEEPAPAVHEDTTVYGNIKASYYYTENADKSISLDSLTTIVFYASPSKTSSHVDAGTVMANGSPLSYDTNTGYSDIKVNLHQQVTWQVSGNSSVPPFSYSYLPTLPACKNLGLIPDSFKKSEGISFNLNGLDNTTGGIVFIGQTADTMTKPLSVTRSVAFSAYEVKGFQVFQPVILNIIATHSSKVKIGERYYRLSGTLWFTKGIYLN